MTKQRTPQEKAEKITEQNLPVHLKGTAIHAELNEAIVQVIEAERARVAVVPSDLDFDNWKYEVYPTMDRDDKLRRIGAQDAFDYIKKSQRTISEDVLRGIKETVYAMKVSYHAGHCYDKPYSHWHEQLQEEIKSLRDAFGGEG